MMDKEMMRALQEDAKKIGEEVLFLDEDGFLLCDSCLIYPADFPSKYCPGCEAYREHQK